MTTPFVTFKVDTTRVVQTIRSVPRLGYFWLRSYLWWTMLDFRKGWLASKSTKFGRGRTGNDIKVSRINEGNRPPKDNEVAFWLQPEERKASSNAAAKKMLDELRADIFTGNKILPVHEHGTDIHSQSWMQVPYRTRPGNMQKWKARNPGAKLITLPSKKDNKLLVYEVLLKRLRGRVSKNHIGPAPMREKLRLRWVLTHDVEMNPTLKLYGTWDDYVGPRDKRWRQAIQNLMQDIVEGKTD